MELGILEQYILVAQVVYKIVSLDGFLGYQVYWALLFFEWEAVMIGQDNNTRDEEPF